MPERTKRETARSLAIVSVVLIGLAWLAVIGVMVLGALGGPAPNIGAWELFVVFVPLWVLGTVFSVVSRSMHRTTMGRVAVAGVVSPLVAVGLIALVAWLG